MRQIHFRPELGEFARSTLPQTPWEPGRGINSIPHPSTPGRDRAPIATRTASLPLWTPRRMERLIGCIFHSVAVVNWTFVGLCGKPSQNSIDRDCMTISCYFRHVEQDSWAKTTARCAQHIWVPWKVSRFLTNAPGYFSRNFNGLLLRLILWVCVQNLKFVAISLPQIMGVLKNLGSPGYANAPFSPKVWMGFCSDGPCKCTSQIWSPYLYPFLR